MRHAAAFVALAPFALALALAAPAAAQPAVVTLPPDGDNQRSTVTQQIGLVRVTVDYSSPDVHSPTGEDRCTHRIAAASPMPMSWTGNGSAICSAPSP